MGGSGGGGASYSEISWALCVAARPPMHSKHKIVPFSSGAHIPRWLPKNPALSLVGHNLLDQWEASNSAARSAADVARADGAILTEGGGAGRRRKVNAATKPVCAVSESVESLGSSSRWPSGTPYNFLHCKRPAPDQMYIEWILLWMTTLLSQKKCATELYLKYTIIEYPSSTKSLHREQLHYCNTLNGHTS